MKYLITLLVALQLLSAVPARSIDDFDGAAESEYAVSAFLGAKDGGDNEGDSSSEEATISDNQELTTDDLVNRLQEFASVTTFNETSALDVALNFSNSQRLKATQAYFFEYEDNFVTTIINRATNLYTKKIFQALYTTDIKFVCSELNDALVKNLNRFETLSEILCDRNANISGIKYYYKKYYGKELSEHINTYNTEITTKKLFLAIVNDTRKSPTQSDSDAPTDPDTVTNTDDKAIATAKSLIEAFTPKLATTRTDIVTRILANETFEQLASVFKQYRNISGLTIYQSINSGLIGDYKTAALSIVDATVSAENYYAEKLKVGSLNALIRIIIRTSESNLKGIIKVFEEITKVSLPSVINTKATGTTTYALLRAIGEPPAPK